MGNDGIYCCRQWPQPRVVQRGTGFVCRLLVHALCTVPTLGNSLGSAVDPKPRPVGSRRGHLQVASSWWTGCLWTAQRLKYLNWYWIGKRNTRMLLSYGSKINFYSNIFAGKLSGRLKFYIINIENIIELHFNPLISWYKISTWFNPISFHTENSQSYLRVLTILLLLWCLKECDYTARSYSETSKNILSEKKSQCRETQKFAKRFFEAKNFKNEGVLLDQFFFQNVARCRRSRLFHKFWEKSSVAQDQKWAKMSP